ncbi:uncharacterized protein [Ptychodera flava]|uniref:uncharacterized protein n=1 Tax=Ptychodera flava TaxID=63121 RepID=UPI00396A407B
MKLSFVLLAALLVGVCEGSSSDSSPENDYSCILTVTRIHDAITNKVMLKGADCHDDLHELKTQADQITADVTITAYHAYEDIEEDGRIIFSITASKLDTVSADDYGTKIVADGDVDGCFNCTTGIYIGLGGTKKTCIPMDCLSQFDGVYVNPPLPVTRSNLFTKCIKEDNDDGSYVTYCKDFTPKLSPSNA